LEKKFVPDDDHLFNQQEINSLLADMASDAKKWKHYQHGEQHTQTKNTLILLAWWTQGVS
jgi:hypothetical protein